MKKSFIRRTMVFFIAICLIPFLIYTAILISKTGDIEQQRIAGSLEAIAEEKAAALQKDLKNIENETINLAEWASFLMAQDSNIPGLSKEYQRDERGVLGRVSSGMVVPSNVFLPAQQELSETLIQEINNSEKMESPMEKIKGQTKDVTYTYMVTAEGLLRVMPYLSNNAFLPDHDQRSDYFYTRAVGDENPDRIAVWTNPYYDYGGNGWIITCSCPYYINGKLGGVVCVDVSLQNLAASIADFRIGDSGFAFVITKEGDVIYHPDMMNIISKSGDRLQTKLLEGREVPTGYETIIRNMMASGNGSGSYLAEDYNYYAIGYHPIESLGWSLGVEVNKAEYSLGSRYITMGFWGLIGGLLLACLLFAYYLSRKITQPIRQLTEDVQNFSEGSYQKVHVQSEDEIGMLGDAFNQMIQDISDNTASLIYGKRQLETVFNSIEGVMMILHPDFTISLMNQEGHDLLGKKGRAPEEFQRCHQLFFDLDHPCPHCPVVKALESGSAVTREITMLQNVYRITAYPVLSEDNQIQEVVVHSIRITDQVLLEQELFQSEKMAGVGQMVAGITHELKNPLAIIKGAVYLIRANKEMPEKQEEALTEITDSLSRSERIITNMLDFSKISQLERELVSVKSQLDQILLLVRQDLVKKKINTHLRFEEEGLQIYGNRDSFKHIFLNIISNAIDAMPEGGDLTIEGSRPSPDTARIIFTNTGNPIPSEDLKRIFQPFYTTKETGTGLGLWIVSKEIQRNQGTIEARSSDRTEIIVTLPCREVPHEKNTDG